MFKEQISSRIWVDRGKEFFNQNVEKLLEKNDVMLYTTHNDLKSCVVERWNRTIKTKMWKYFTANNNTRKYIDILPALIEDYNNSYHRSIKTTPSKARLEENDLKVTKALYGKKETKIHPKFKIGDRVRITPNWRDEIFIISKIKSTIPTTYVIRDERGEELGGTFYEPELQKSKTDEYRVEKVLKKRVRNGKKQEYVKWYGYDNTHNSWINA